MGILCLCLSEPGRLRKWPAVASAAAIEDDQEKWEKQPTPRDATVPKAKETHQAHGGWTMGNLQHPKPPPSRLGSPGILGLQSQEESPQN